MADADVIAKEHPTEAAWRELYGPVGEAQALIELYRTQDDDVSWALLARGILERLLSQIEVIEGVEGRHGRLTVDERLGWSTAPRAPLPPAAVQAYADTNGVPPGKGSPSSA